MDTVEISYLAAGFVKNKAISGDLVTYHTIDDITIVVTYSSSLDVVEDYMFRDVFYIHRIRTQLSSAKLAP